jgi:hypothetical protein
VKPSRRSSLFDDDATLTSRPYEICSFASGASGTFSTRIVAMPVDRRTRVDNEQTITSATDQRREYVKPQLEHQPDWDIATGNSIPGPSQDV